MEGLILLINTNNSKDTTKINNILFGRVVTTIRKNTKYYYYYKGLLNSVKYYKLSKGCYFIKYNLKLHIGRDISTINCNLDIKEDELITPYEYYKQKYKNIEVVNL